MKKYYVYVEQKKMLRYEVDADNENEASKIVSKNLKSLEFKETDFEFFVHPYVELKVVSKNRNDSDNYLLHDFEEFK